MGGAPYLAAFSTRFHSARLSSAPSASTTPAPSVPARAHASCRRSADRARRALDELREQLAHVDRLEVRRQPGRVQPRRGQHVLDQPLELGEIAPRRRAARAASCRRRASSSSATRMRASGERSSCDTLASSSLWPRTSVLDALGHLVPRARQLLQLVGRAVVMRAMALPAPPAARRAARDTTARPRRSRAARLGQPLDRREMRRASGHGGQPDDQQRPAPTITSGRNRLGGRKRRIGDASQHAATCVPSRGSRSARRRTSVARGGPRCRPAAQLLQLVGGQRRQLAAGRRSARGRRARARVMSMSSSSERWRTMRARGARRRAAATTHATRRGAPAAPSRCA